MNKIIISLTSYHVLDNFLNLEFFLVFSILEYTIGKLLEQYREQNLYFLYFREVVRDVSKTPFYMFYNRVKLFFIFFLEHIYHTALLNKSKSYFYTLLIMETTYVIVVGTGWKYKNTENSWVYQSKYCLNKKTIRCNWLKIRCSLFFKWCWRLNLFPFLIVKW